MRRGPKTPAVHFPMPVHARRLLLAGLLAAGSGRDAHAEDPSEPPEPALLALLALRIAPAATRGIDASVPQEPTPSVPQEPPGAAQTSDSSAPASPADGEPTPPEVASPLDMTARAHTSRPPRATQTPRAERSIELVPRQFGAALGWSYLAHDTLPDALVSDPRPRPHGVALDTHVLWQIAGLSRRWPTWIGPQLGLDVFPATPVTRRVIALGYGFRIKHQLGRHPWFHPYLSYGVGAVLPWVKTIPGRGIGHQTRISLGTAVPIGGLTSLTLALVYKHQGLATFRWDDAGTLSYSFHTVGVLLGIAFDAKPRRTRPRPRTAPT